MELERKDIQGLIVSSYKHLPCAAFLLLQIRNAAAVRGWLARQVGNITTAEKKHSHFSMNLAFTHPGMQKLGLSNDTLATFSSPFQEGMATARRSQVLGDDDVNDPSNWEWGSGARVIDVLLLLYAIDEPTLETQLAQRSPELAISGGFDVVKILHAGRQPNTHEHFGFNDGIGQPVMAGTGNKARQLKRTNHATELPAGEFLLAHPNAYGVIADTPVVNPENDPRQLLHKVPDKATALGSKPGMHDLGRNGTYLVFRQLAQDVAKFWNFLDQATRVNGVSDPTARDRLGAKFVGRWKSGAPLVLAPQKDNPALFEENNFGYTTNHDAQGFACPIGSHIRRSNPRDSIGPDPQTALDTANRHRILRRGRSYGQRLADPLVDDGQERGLQFICLNSDIERQFEFVQQTWANNPVFGGLYNEVDPLVGNVAKGNKTFTVPADPLRTCVQGLSRFVKVKGGAYFFLPSIRALKYLASL
jgi:Dyp-type peroxidase family